MLHTGIFLAVNLAAAHISDRWSWRLCSRWPWPAFRPLAPVAKHAGRQRQSGWPTGGRLLLSILFMMSMPFVLVGTFSGRWNLSVRWRHGRRGAQRSGRSDAMRNSGNASTGSTIPATRASTLVQPGRSAFSASCPAVSAILSTVTSLSPGRIPIWSRQPQAAHSERTRSETPGKHGDRPQQRLRRGDVGRQQPDVDDRGQQAVSP